MKTLFYLALCTGIVGLSNAQSNPIHPKILLDADWRFCRGDAGSPVEPTGIPIPTWKWVATSSLDSSKVIVDPKVGTDGADWKVAKTGEDVFKGRVGFAVFKAALPKALAKSPVLHFEGVDDNADVFVNGRFLLHHEGWDDPFDVPLAAGDSGGEASEIEVVVENTNGPGGITKPVSLGDGEPITTATAALPTYNDLAWRKVHLPHDYVIEGRFDEREDNSHGSLPKPTAWYRKSFLIPADAKGKSIALQFDGIYRNSKVWLNGHYLGSHSSGYTEARYEIDKFAKFGEPNVVAVHVDPSHNEGWWYEGGGIYRHVWLDISNPLSIAPHGVFVTTKFEEPVGNAPVQSATITVNTELQTDSKQEFAAQLNMRILDDRDQTVATASTLINLPDSISAPMSVKIASPKLWSLEHPYIYRVISEVEVNDKVVDRRFTAFGIRTIHFDAEKGFFLNGKHVEIQGTCNHQDFAGVGIAVPDSLEYWRVRKLKEMGSNAWRMSHNPPTPALLDACDRLGMLVMDENRHLGNNPQTLEELSNMVLRDRNHPSIILWSMCNEQPEAGGAKGRAIFKDMIATVKHFDETRPVSSAMNSGWFGEGFTGVEDLMGVNYNYEVYEKFHGLHPEIPLFGSETASTTTTRSEYADDKVRTYVSSYNMTDDSWKPAAIRPYVAGTFVWTGFDYKGEPSPYSWPCINSNFGIMDLCGFPKDNYYYYQSWWKSTPAVHIMPHWNWPGKEGEKVKVIVFSNAARVQLLLNNILIGTQEMPRNGHLEWWVPYSPGTLVARGIDSNDTIVATDKVSTTGAPAAIRLVNERQTLRGNGEDMEVVAAEVIDSEGRVCPMADNLVNFTVTGAGYIAGVGNGNPSDHSPDKARFRKAFHGKCIVILGTGEKTGPIHLSASSPGLKSVTKQFLAK